MARKTWLFSASDPVSVAVAEDALERGYRVVMKKGGCSKCQMLAEKYPPDQLKFLQNGFDPRHRSHCLTAVTLCQTVDVLVNSFFSYTHLEVAALSAPGSTSEALRRQIDEVLVTSVNMIEAVLPVISSDGGKIIQLSDINGSFTTPALGLSVIAFKALEGYCESIAMAVAQRNIQLTIVSIPMELSFSVMANNKNEGLRREKIGCSSKSLDIANHSTIVESARAVDSVASWDTDDVSFQQKLSEVVQAVSYIAVLKDPPLRLIAGTENIEQIKEKIAAMSDDLDEMAEISLALDN